MHPRIDSHVPKLRTIVMVSRPVHFARPTSGTIPGGVLHGFLYTDVPLETSVPHPLVRQI